MKTSTPYWFLIDNGKMRCRHCQPATGIPDIRDECKSGDGGLMKALYVVDYVK